MNIKLCVLLLIFFLIILILFGNKTIEPLTVNNQKVCTSAGAHSLETGTHVNCCSGLTLQKINGRSTCVKDSNTLKLGSSSGEKQTCANAGQDIYDQNLYSVPTPVSCCNNQGTENVNGLILCKSDNSGGQSLLTPCPYNNDNNNIFVAETKGGGGCTSQGKEPTQFAPYVNTCNGKDITLKGNVANKCIYRTTHHSNTEYDNIDLNKVKQINFDVSAKNCGKDWASIWLDPKPYDYTNTPWTSGEIDMIEVLRGTANHFFAGCKDGYNCKEVQIPVNNINSFKKHITLESDGNGHIKVNNCDGEEPCTNDSGAFIKINKVGNPNKTYSIVSDIWKVDGNGTSSATDCEFTMKNLNITYR